MLNEQKISETLTNDMVEPKEGNSTQHHCDMKAY